MTLKDFLRPGVIAASRFRQRPSLAELAWSRPRSFAQFGEDLWLIDHFAGQKTGFYVDVGAFHPFLLSNTYLLWKRGWRGLNVEPAPKGVAMFERYRPDDINLSCAVSSSPGDVTFTLAGRFGGIDDHLHLWKGVYDERISVEALPLAEILDRHLEIHQQIDLLDVDCEGRDLDILRSNDWGRYRPRVILVEQHDHAEVSPNAFLEKLGYRLVTQLDLTLVFVDQ